MDAVSKFSRELGDVTELLRVGDLVVAREAACRNSAGSAYSGRSIEQGVLRPVEPCR